MPSKKSQYLRCLNCHAINKPQLKYSFQGFELFICNSCSNGFINPIPKDMKKYYPEGYWKIPGILGEIKDQVYDFFQLRRAVLLRSYIKRGLVLDVGSGEALFAKQMKGFEVISIDFPGSKVKNSNVLKLNFLKWNTNKKFDAIVFWQSLEHVPDSGKYLDKAYKLLRNGGLIFIECPQFDSFESKLFGKNWYHLDPPRHLSHFSIEGLTKVLKKQGLSIIAKRNVISPEHAYTGLLASLLNSFGFNFMESYLKKNNGVSLLVSAFILSPVAIIFETILLLLGHSPIMLIIARKIK